MQCCDAKWYLCQRFQPGIISRSRGQLVLDLGTALGIDSLDLSEYKDIPTLPAGTKTSLDDWFHGNTEWIYWRIDGSARSFGNLCVLLAEEIHHWQYESIVAALIG